MATARRSSKKQLGPVAFLGVGPGEEGLLTLRALDLLATAEVVVTDESVPETVLTAHARPDAEVVNAEEVDVAAVLITAARAGRSAVRLCRGDAYLDGSAVIEVEALAKAKLTAEVVPGVSVLASIAALGGVPLHAASAPIVVLGSLDQLVEAPRLAGKNTLLVDVVLPTEAKRLSALFLEAGFDADAPVLVLTAAGTVQQRSVLTSPANLAADCKAAGLTGAATAVLGEAVRRRDRHGWFASRPLFGWRVLVPRTRAQAGEASGLLRALGADPLEVPTIAVEPPRTPAPMERAIRGLVSGRYAWVAFTSTNAVKAVRERLDEYGLDARAFAGVKVAAVGEATAKVLQDMGIRPDLVPSREQSSEGLLKDWPEFDDLLDPLDRVFLPRADIATETLVAGLKERGWAVDDITAYRTVRAAPPPAPVREAIKGGKVDAVLFTSSSTVRNLLGIAGKPHERTVIACIGPATAATARELGLRVDVVASTSTVEGLTADLAEHALLRRAEAEAAGEPVLTPAATRKPKTAKR